MSSRLDILLHPVHGGAIKDIGLYAVIGIGFYLTYRALLHRSSDGRRISAMRTLRGPQSDSFLNGCLDFITEPNDMNRLEAWIRDFGKAFVFPSFFTREIYLTDLKAIAFIFNHPLLFRKPVLVTRAIQRFVGTGLFTAEGEAHKKQVSWRCNLHGIFEAQADGMRVIYHQRKVLVRFIFSFFLSIRIKEKR